MIDLFGNVVFYSHTEETSIYADTLYWKDKDEKLLADPEATILVKKDDGSYMEGKGFSTDFKLREIIFTNGVKGTYIKSGKEDDEEREAAEELEIDIEEIEAEVEEKETGAEEKEADDDEKPEIDFTGHRE